MTLVELTTALLLSGLLILAATAGGLGIMLASRAFSLLVTRLFIGEVRPRPERCSPSPAAFPSRCGAAALSASVIS